MIKSEIVQEIVSTFRLRPSKNGKIYVGMELKKIKSFISENAPGFLAVDSVREEMYVSKLNLEDLSRQIELGLESWCKEVISSPDLQGLPQDTEDQKSFIRLSPFFNIRTGDIELMDTIVGGVSEVHHKVWAHTYSIMVKDLPDISPKLYPMYRPDIKGLLIETNVSNFPYRILNTYSMPEWERDDLGQPKMPEIFRKFFFHLFPSDESRLAAYHHLYYMLTERSQVLLCLAGRQAIGKSIFAETIIKAMIGKSNWQKAPRSFTKKEFNGFLKNRRVVVVEEIPLAANREERTATNEMIKDILNDTVTIEEKGVDAFTIDNHVTVFVTTNTPKAIPLVDMNDRRFLCLDVTKNQLRKSMSDSEIIKLKNMTDSSPEIADLCRWILANGKIEGKDAFYNFTNDLKRKIYFLTLSSWELGILEWIDINKNEYTQGIPMEHIVKEAKKHNMGKAVKPSTVEEFLNKHQMMGGGFIGDVSNSRLYLTEDAMNNPVSDSIKGLERELFGIDEDDEDFLTKMEKESSL